MPDDVLDTRRECAVHSVHHPSVAVVVDMPIFPTELQVAAGIDPPTITDTVTICPTGAANVEACWRYMIGQGPQPAVKIGRATWDLAQRTVDLYESTLPPKRRHAGE